MNRVFNMSATTETLDSFLQHAIKAFRKRSSEFFNSAFFIFSYFHLRPMDGKVIDLGMFELSTEFAAVILLIIGSVRLTVLVINGNWDRSPTARWILAIASILIAVPFAMTTFMPAFCLVVFDLIACADAGREENVRINGKRIN